LALAALLADEASARETINPLAPKPPHFPARAKNCISFSSPAARRNSICSIRNRKVNKARRAADAGVALEGSPVRVIQKDSARILASPRTFARFGKSGLEFCDLLPQIATHADDICMNPLDAHRAVQSSPATVMLNSGFERMGRPTIGSWLLYGLGNESHDLPGYVVLEPGPGIRGGATNWSSGFLPSLYGATQFH